MSDYTQATDFGDKDALTTGNPAKLIKGTEVDTELTAIAAAIATKYDDTKLTALAALTSTNAANDYAIVYDASAAAFKRVLLQYIHPQLKWKSAGTSRTSTATLADDPDLAGWILQPSSSYVLRLFLRVSSASATPDFQYALDVNGQAANLTALGGFSVAGDAAATDASVLSGGFGQVAQGMSLSATIPRFLQITYFIVTNASFVDGTALDLQWAQGTSNGTATLLDLYSFGVLEKVG